MKTVFVLLLIVSAAFARMAVDESIVNTVNSKGAWKAKLHSKFANMDLNDAKKSLGLKLGVGSGVPVMHYDNAGNSLPTNFDSRTEWPNCVHKVQNQGQCGSCWAFGATETLADRFCVAGKPIAQLSAQDPVSCDKGDSGCGGGYLQAVWDYMTETGVVDDDCMPYASGSGSVPSCPSKCTGKGTWKKYHAKSYHTFTKAEDIMEEIYTNGPVDTGFMVYQDFFAYSSGVYYHQTGGLAGGHSVEIIGWGHDNETNLDYWIVKNSWGTTWGIDGYFWIKKGDNECEIEQNVIAGLPDIADDEQMALDDKIIKYVNSGREWTATRTKRFEGVTLAQAKKLLGGTKRPRFIVPSVKSGAAPTTWDWRTESKCVHPIRNQAQCGSCWAFGCAESITDRFCLASKGSVDVVLSPQTLVSCDHTDMGCNGGQLQNAWAFAAENGLATDKCMPYESGSGSVPSCPSKCKDGSKPEFYKVKESSIKTYSDEESIMNEVHENGPAEVSFAVYQDFFSYSSGIYSHKTGGLAGYHAVKVVGWGVQDGTKYWIIANSWDTTWGQKGYFWIKKGVNECEIESNCVGGAPIIN